MPMKEGPFGRSESISPEVLGHRLGVVDPAVDQVGLPALEAYFGPSVIDDQADRVALEAKLASQADARNHLRDSVPVTLARLAAAREGERSEDLSPVVPISGFVEHPHTAAAPLQPYDQNSTQPQTYQPPSMMEAA